MLRKKEDSEGPLGFQTSFSESPFGDDASRKARKRRIVGFAPLWGRKRSGSPKGKRDEEQRGRISVPPKGRKQRYILRTLLSPRRGERPFGHEQSGPKGRKQPFGVSLYITYITVPPKGRKALWARAKRPEGAQSGPKDSEGPLGIYCGKRKEAFSPLAFSPLGIYCGPEGGRNILKRLSFLC